MSVSIKHTRSELTVRKAGSCAHFWKIDEADGPSSRAVCRVCGRTKTFYNSFQPVLAELKAEKPNGKNGRLRRHPN